ncbi:MAG: alpha/beta hydrolase fold domain-containing protein [Ferruginibacter sp.]
MQSFILLIAAIFCFAPAKSQFSDDSVSVDGISRTFHFNEPDAKMENASLVFVLHGSGGDGLGAAKGTAKLEAISQKENILLIYPDGYKRYWNECRKAATSAANIENIDENTFFSLMIDYFTKKYHADPQHVFVVGTSGGGHMAYKLALTMPEKIKAITAIIANLPDSANMDCTTANVPVSVMIINGTNDQVNPYNGGEVKITGAYLGTVRSTEQTFN